MTVSRMILSELAPLVSAQHGVFYINESQNGEPELTLLASYAYPERKNLANRFKAGEGLVGQCALEKQRILLTDVPGDYVQISSGLGEAHAAEHRRAAGAVRGRGQGGDRAGLVLPLQRHPPDLPRPAHREHRHRAQHDRRDDADRGAAEAVAVARRRAADAAAGADRDQHAARSSRRARCRPPRSGSSSSRRSCSRPTRSWRRRPSCSPSRTREVERKNREIEQARLSLEEKAEQLALTSKYKSEFLANMSHELRTPLNSLLILSKLLSQNPDGNLTEKQVEFARTIHSSGSDLLALINEILDLSKIESGTMDVDVEAGAVRASCTTTSSATFRQVATSKGLDFDVALDGRLPPTIDTDPKRLQQVLKNLLSNAFKFTDTGSVHADDRASREAGWSADQRTLNTAPRGDRLPRHRHRHRHPGRQAPHHLRGVPAGRRHHQPQVRRHRPRPVDQPRDRAAARRRDPADQRGRRGQHVHALPARASTTPTELDAAAADVSSAADVGRPGRRRARRRTRSTSR